MYFWKALRDALDRTPHERAGDDLTAQSETTHIIPRSSEENYKSENAISQQYKKKTIP